MSIMRNMDGQTILSSIGYEMGKLNIWHTVKLK